MIHRRRREPRFILYRTSPVRVLMPIKETPAFSCEAAAPRPKAECEAERIFLSRNALLDRVSRSLRTALPPARFVETANDYSPRIEVHGYWGRFARPSSGPPRAQRPDATCL